MSDEPGAKPVAAQVELLLARMEALRASLDDTALKRIEAGQIKMRADMMERIDRLENGITGMRDDLAVTLGASDSVRRAHNNTREEMRDISESVSALYRKLARLETQMRELKGDP